MRLPRNIDAASLDQAANAPSAHQGLVRAQQSKTRIDTQGTTSTAQAISAFRDEAVRSAMEQSTAELQANRLKQMYSWGLQQAAGIDGYKAKAELAQFLRAYPGAIDYLG